MEGSWTEFLYRTLDAIPGYGWVGWIWFIAIYSFTCIVFLPGSALTIGAGAIYGFWWGTLLVSIGNMVGATLSFLISRYLARGWMQKKLSHSKRFRALDRLMTTDGWKMLFLSRLSPVVPHSIVSYAAGLSRMSLGKYILVSWVGFVPISAAYSYAGVLLRQVTKASLGHPGTTPLGWVAYSLGAIVTIAVCVLSAKMVWKALGPRAES
ncbi:MAG TPA: TVP38/TMEM64 family protein [Chthoniobacterales bacterium]